MGSNLIVIGTLIFLFVSAVLLVLMLYSMMKKQQERINRIVPFNSNIPDDSASGANSYFGDDGDSTTDLLQDLHYARKLTEAKAIIIYRGVPWSINKPRYKIGRGGECDLAPPDRSISRLHCEICYQDDNDTFILLDLNSTYGTYVNGERVKEPIELHDGDEIRMGKAVMTFKRRNERKTDDSGAENPSQQTD